MPRRPPARRPRGSPNRQAAASSPRFALAANERVRSETAVEIVGVGPAIEPILTVVACVAEQLIIGIPAEENLGARVPENEVIARKSYKLVAPQRTEKRIAADFYPVYQVNQMKGCAYAT